VSELKSFMSPLRRLSKPPAFLNSRTSVCGVRMPLSSDAPRGEESGLPSATEDARLLGVGQESGVVDIR
jgi:hypothetical protein